MDLEKYYEWFDKEFGEDGVAVYIRDTYGPRIWQAAVEATEEKTIQPE